LPTISILNLHPANKLAKFWLRMKLENTNFLSPAIGEREHGIG